MPLPNLKSFQPKERRKEKPQNKNKNFKNKK